MDIAISQVQILSPRPQFGLVKAHFGSGARVDHLALSDHTDAVRLTSLDLKLTEVVDSLGFQTEEIIYD
jgi:hypothetical protein